MPMRSRIAVASLALLTLSLPVAALAAPASSFDAARALLEATSTAGNAYDAGATVTVTGPVGGDLTALGGSVVLATDVAGDALLLGGSVGARGKVTGDLRALGGTVNADGTVRGDFVAAGFSVHDAALASGSTFVAALDANLSNGARGPVTVYGNTVTLGGDFTGDVHVVASGHVTLMASTTIAGSLTYDSPEEATIPASASIAGGTHYTSTSYLPSAGASRILAFASIGIFLLARLLGALILAGLLAGLFPKLSEAVVSRAVTGGLRSTFLTMLLGFAVLVATPILLLMLLLTFVGIGIALLLFFAYALLTLLAFIYAGILLGALIARRLERRTFVLWRDGVLGMLILSLVAFAPFVGGLLVFLCMLFSAGALVLLFFHYAFPHD